MQIASRRTLAAGIFACAVVTSVTRAAPAMAARQRSEPRASPSASPAAEPAAGSTARRWVLGRLPPGGALQGAEVVHTVRSENETWLSIAEAYLELTGVYDPTDLARAIANENAARTKRTPSLGVELHIPHVLSRAPKSGAAE